MDVFVDAADYQTDILVKTEASKHASHRSNKHGSAHRDFTALETVKKAELLGNSEHSKKNSLSNTIHLGSKHRRSHQKSLKLGEIQPCNEFFTITSD